MAFSLGTSTARCTAEVELPTRLDVSYSAVFDLRLELTLVSSVCLDPSLPILGAPPEDVGGVLAGLLWFLKKAGRLG